MKVKDIVNKKEKVTYKEVAENLVQELDLKSEENENVYILILFKICFCVKVER